MSTPRRARYYLEVVLIKALAFIARARLALEPRGSQTLAAPVDRTWTGCGHGHITFFLLQCTPKRCKVSYPPRRLRPVITSSGSASAQHPVFECKYPTSRPGVLQRSLNGELLSDNHRVSEMLAARIALCLGLCAQYNDVQQARSPAWVNACQVLGCTGRTVILYGSQLMTH